MKVSFMRKPETGMQTFRVAMARMIMTSIPLVNLRPASLAIRLPDTPQFSLSLSLVCVVCVCVCVCVVGGGGGGGGGGGDWMEAWDSLFCFSSHTPKILMMRNRRYLIFDLSLSLTPSLTHSLSLTHTHTHTHTPWSLLHNLGIQR